MKNRVTTVDEYLDTVDDEKRTALEKLRKTIQSAAPKAVEGISYQIPIFKLNGMLVGYGAAKKHCAFYVLSGTVLESFEDDLEGYDTSKGTIRFQPDRPIPATLVRRIVKARIEENSDRPPRRRASGKQ